MKKMINQEFVSGRVYSHTLAKKVTGETSKNPGTQYIGGKLNIVTDEAGLNVVSVDYTYVTPESKWGPNKTYAALEAIINGPTVESDGMENALCVTASANLDVNDFYSTRNGEETLVTAKINASGFNGGRVSIVSAKDLNSDESKRATFEVDMLMKRLNRKEADETKGLPERMNVIGYVFDWTGAIKPVDMFIYSEPGMNYLESLEVSEKNPILTKVTGQIKSIETVVRKVEEQAWGDPVIKEYKNSNKEWVITSCAAVPYDREDPNNGCTNEDITTALANREKYLAERKASQAARQATKVKPAAAAADMATASVKDGGFLGW